MHRRPILIAAIAWILAIVLLAILITNRPDSGPGKIKSCTDIGRCSAVACSELGRAIVQQTENGKAQQCDAEEIYCCSEEYLAPQAPAPIIL